MSQENVDALRAALSARGADFLAVLDPHAEFHAPDWGVDPGVYGGLDAITRWLRNWQSAWEGYEAEALEYIDADPHVLVEHLQRGRSRETGLSFDVRHWSVFSFTNGKVTVALLPNAGTGPRSRGAVGVAHSPQPAAAGQLSKQCRNKHIVVGLRIGGRRYWLPGPPSKSGAPRSSSGSALG